MTTPNECHVCHLPSDGPGSMLCSASHVQRCPFCDAGRRNAHDLGCRYVFVEMAADFWKETYVEGDGDHEETAGATLAHLQAWIIETEKGRYVK